MSLEANASFPRESVYYTQLYQRLQRRVRLRMGRINKPSMRYRTYGVPSEALASYVPVDVCFPEGSLPTQPNSVDDLRGMYIFDDLFAKHHTLNHPLCLHARMLELSDEDAGKDCPLPIEESAATSLVPVHGSDAKGASLPKADAIGYVVFMVHGKDIRHTAQTDSKRNNLGTVL